MFKTLSLILGLLLFPALSQASSSSGKMTNAAGTLGKMFTTTEAVPVTYAPKTAVGPGVVITKLFYNPVSAAGVTFTVWDAPNGQTYAAGAIIKLVITDPAYAGTGLRTLDLTTGTSNRTDDDGLGFKYYPTVVTSGTNTPNAFILFRPLAGQGASRPVVQ